MPGHPAGSELLRTIANDIDRRSTAEARALLEGADLLEAKEKAEALRLAEFKGVYPRETSKAFPCPHCGGVAVRSVFDYGPRGGSMHARCAHECGFYVHATLASRPEGWGNDDPVWSYGQVRF